MIVGAYVGVPVGIQLLTSVEPHVLRLALGVCMLLFAAERTAHDLGWLDTSTSKPAHADTDTALLREPLRIRTSRLLGGSLHPALCGAATACGQNKADRLKPPWDRARVVPAAARPRSPPGTTGPRRHRPPSDCGDGRPRVGHAQWRAE